MMSVFLLTYTQIKKAVFRSTGKKSALKLI